VKDGIYYSRLYLKIYQNSFIVLRIILFLLIPTPREENTLMDIENIMYDSA